MRRTALIWWLFGLGIAVLGAAGFLVFKAQRSDGALDKIEEVLHRLKKDHSAIQAEVLSLQSGTAKSFHRLTGLISGASREHRTLEILVPEVLRNPAVLTRELEEAAAAWRARTVQLEAFKTKRALLNNSEKYLLTLLRSIDRRARSEPSVSQLKTRLSDLQLEIMEGLIDYGSLGPDRIERIFQNFRSIESLGENVIGSLKLAQRHLTLFSNMKRAVAAHIEQVNSNFQQDKIGVIHGKISQIREEKANVYRRMVLRLGLASAILVFFLAHIGARLVRETETVKKQATDLAHIARHDSLTDLRNRMCFREDLEACLADSAGESGMALIRLDLDNFKETNDRYGHQVGDALLRAIAGRLRKAMTENEILVRPGGDEFAVVQRAVSDPREARSVAEAVMRQLDEPFVVEEKRIKIGASISVALAPEDGSTVDAIMTATDLALSAAKADGKGRIQFYDELIGRRFREHHEIRRNLKEALANQEFELHYQPIVAAESRQPACMEALIRWRHPTRGLVSPATFIPVAEESGLIVEIGEWVLRTACSRAAEWPEGITVSVNLSPAQFVMDDLIEVIEKALHDSGLPASRLQLEITETFIFSDKERALEILQRLRDLGCSVALDDFGTGYSSLNQVLELPVDTVKLDRSFVSRIDEDQRAIAITRTIIRLAHQLGMSVTAEGVETIRQHSILRALNCETIQGYLISPPLPEDDAREFLGVDPESASVQRRSA